MWYFGGFARWSDPSFCRALLLNHVLILNLLHLLCSVQHTLLLTILQLIYEVLILTWSHHLRILKRSNQPTWMLGRVSCSHMCQLLFTSLGWMICSFTHACNFAAFISTIWSKYNILLARSDLVLWWANKIVTFVNILKNAIYWVILGRIRRCLGTCAQCSLQTLSWFLRLLDWLGVIATLLVLFFIGFWHILLITLLIRHGLFHSSRIVISFRILIRKTCLSISWFSHFMQILINY